MSRGNLNAPRQRRNRWKVFGLPLLALVVLIWFAPTIIARTSLKDRLVGWAAPDLDGRVAIGSAGLGWMSPIVLRDVEATDEEGEPVLSIAEVRGDKSLSALLLDRSDLGTFHVERPEIHVRLRDGLSNVEDALQELRQRDPESDSDAANLSARIEIEEGQVVIDDLPANRQWKVEGLNLVLELLPDAVPGFKLSGSGNLSNDRQQSGSVTAQTEGNHVQIKMNGAPLDIVEPFLHRNHPDTQLVGTMTGEIRFQPGEATGQAKEEPTTAVNAELRIDQLEAASPDQLGSDTLHLDEVTVRGNLRVAGDLIMVDKFSIQTDFAEVAAQGTWDASDSQEGSRNQLFGDQDCVVKVTVDLARLAQLLPDTLNIREGTQITSGNVQLQFSSHDAGSGRKWNGRLDSSNLVGQTNTGRAVSWQKPVSVTFEAHDDPAGVVIDQLVCQSDFLTANGKGTLDAASFTAECDLNRLVDQLGQFVDVDRWQLSGRAQAELDWKCREGEPLAVNGSAEVVNFEFFIPPDEPSATPARPWVEPQLTMKINATGTTADQGLEQVDTAIFRFIAGDDQLTAQLVQPVDYTDKSASWPVDLSIIGDLGSWSSRLRPWIDLSQWDIRGTVNGASRVHLGDEIADIESSKIELGSVLAANEAWNIDESVVILETKGRLDGQQRKLTGGSAVFKCTSVSMKIDDLQVEVPEDSTPAAQGNIKYRADLARLSRWFTPRGEQPTQRLAGQLNGNVQLAHLGDATQAQWNTLVKDLVVERNQDDTRLPAGALPVSQTVAWESVWSEKELQIGGNGTLDQETETFRLEKLQVQSELLAITAAGQVSDVLDSRVAGISGQLHYDVENIVQSLRGYVGPGLELVGKKQSPFTVRGALTNKKGSGSSSPIPSELVVEGSFGWDSGNAYGLVLGPANVQARLEDQIVSFSPIEIQVNDGYLRCTPQITFQQDPALLVLAPGTVLDRISITRQMCEEWLKYLAPLLADATRIDGQLSVDLEHATVPLKNSSESEVKGVATIHSGSVRPGPLTEPFIDIVRTIRRVARRGPLAGVDSNDPRLTTVEQQVQFQLTEERVYHRDMLVQLGDMPIRTGGSVGLDEIIDILAEIQIPETWIRDGSILSSWKGKVIQIPIRGTLDDPDLDRSAIANITTDLIAEPVQRIIDSGILRGLDRLFDRD